MTNRIGPGVERPQAPRAEPPIDHVLREPRALELPASGNPVLTVRQRADNFVRMRTPAMWATFTPVMGVDVAHKRLKDVKP